MGPSVTVLKGSIGVRRDGVSVIEVKNGGKSLAISRKSSTINFIGNDGYGVYMGEGMMINLTSEGVGVKVSEKGTLMLMNVGISGFTTGMNMTGAGSLTMRDRTTISLASGGKYGVYAVKTEEMTLQKVEILKKRLPYGVFCFFIYLIIAMYLF